MPIMNYEYFKKYPEFKGLFVGGCIDRGDGSSFRARAHAHCNPEDKNKGWICVRSIKRIGNGKPSMLMLHELAHLLVDPKDWHGDKWRAKVRELGGIVHYWETREYHQLKRAGYRNIYKIDLKKKRLKMLLGRVKE